MFFCYFFFSNHSYVLTISFFELYNNSLTDLLDPSRTNLKIQKNKMGKVVVTGLSQIPVSTVDEAMSLMAHGERSRAYHETDLNASSSRSHCVFIVNMTKTSIPRKQERTHARNASILHPPPLHLLSEKSGQWLSDAGEM